ncbi:hypothetical protein [Streptomyces sp. NPDC058614]|uniref:hypothetical protein n=1 Tax=Streptomyces sp. NPDC058614 TaxID=3346557 RepID=UPI00364D2EA8
MNEPEMTSAGTRTRCDGADCRKKTAGPAELAAPRLRLCPGCLHLFTGRLRQLPGLYAELEEVLSAGPSSEGRERTTGGPVPSGLPFNAAAADVRAEILATLGSWSGLVVTQRGVPAPERTVRALAGLLMRHAGWLAAHPAAADATREVARLERAAHRVARRETLRRVSVGDCVAPGCTGRLVTVVRGGGSDGSDGSDGSGSDGAGAGIQCDADPSHAWPGRLWTELRRALRGGQESGQESGEGSGQEAGNTPQENPPQERWLTAGDIARLWSTPTGTVYRLASEQRWRRRTRSGRTYYAESDVHECFVRRSGAGT